MSLIKWEPLSEFDRLFEERLIPSFAKVGWDLAVDVYEEKGNVVAKMSLPGVDANEIEVSIEDSILTISGCREEEKESKETRETKDTKGEKENKK